MYPLDRRRIASHIYELLHSLRRTAILLCVSHSTVSRWIAQPHKIPYKKRDSPKTYVLSTCLRSVVANNPFLSLRNIQLIIYQTTQCSVSYQLIRTVLKSIGISKKKARFHGRPERVIRHTHDFLSKRDALSQEGRSFVSVDETSFGRNGTPVYGYAPRSSPLFVKQKPPRTTTTSVLTAVKQNGKPVLSKKIGSFDSISFVDALKSFSFERGTVVLLDNVAFHHSRVVKQYARECDIHLLYVPAYSPWYNPVEGVFSVVKRHYRIHNSIEDAFDAITHRHVKAFFDKSFSLQNSPEFVEIS